MRTATTANCSGGMLTCCTLAICGVQLCACVAASAVPAQFFNLLLAVLNNLHVRTSCDQAGATS
jgi:hypothetical protein